MEAQQRGLMQPGRQQYYSDLMRRATPLQIHGMRALSLSKNTPACSPWAQLHKHGVVQCISVGSPKSIYFFHVYLLWSLGRHRVLISFTQVLRHLVWRFWPQGLCNGGERNFICGPHHINKITKWKLFWGRVRLWVFKLDDTYSAREKSWWKL